MQEPSPDWQEADDGQLIRFCLDGNEQAWTTLIQRYSRLIYAIPLRFGFTKSVADEIFQETCLILLEQLDTLYDWERLSAWIVTVTRRACIYRLRQQAKEKTLDWPALEEKSDDVFLENELITLEQHYMVRMALDSLPDRCRRLLEALFFQEPAPSYEEIAAELQIPVGSIGPTRLRCLEKFRQAVLHTGLFARATKVDGT